MRDVPNSCGFLAFPPGCCKPLALGNPLRYFASVFNGSHWLVVTRRDTNATWRSLGTLCRELDWSKRRLLHELQHGLPYQTIPPGWTIDWHSPTTEQTLNLDASEVTIISAASPSSAALLDCTTVAIEILWPPPEDAPPIASPPAGLGPQTDRVLRVLPMIYPPDGKPPVGMSIPAIRRKVLAALTAERESGRAPAREKDLRDPSPDIVSKAVNHIGRST
jgi:hypothetical protein